MKIPEHNYTVRERTAVDVLEKHPPLKGILNAGFHNWEDPRRHWWIKICEANGLLWHILEIYRPNVEDALSGGCPPDRITEGDIAQLKSCMGADCLLFWHGPEHLPKQSFLNILPVLESLFTTLIFGMPIGAEPQDEAYGNPFERHVSDWNRREWEELGYTVIEVYDKQKYPHMTVYKHRG